MYHGPAGICDFGAFLATFRQPDYRLVEQLHSGTGTVVVKESLTPTVLATNKTVKQAMQNLVASSPAEVCRCFCFVLCFFLSRCGKRRGSKGCQLDGTKEVITFQAFKELAVSKSSLVAFVKDDTGSPANCCWMVLLELTNSGI